MQDKWELFSQTWIFHLICIPHYSYMLLFRVHSKFWQKQTETYKSLTLLIKYYRAADSWASLVAQACLSSAQS